MSGSEGGGRDGDVEVNRWEGGLPQLNAEEMRSKTKGGIAQE